jgi:hypothetical protein
MATNFNRWDLLSVNKGRRDARVAANRASGDRYHKNKIFGGKGGLPHPGRSSVARLLRRSNNGNMPGHGVGGVPGNGVGGGIPSMHMLGLGGLRKNHHAMTSGSNTGPKIGGGGSGAVNAPNLKAAPFFQKAKPMAVRKINSNFGTKQPKPMTSVPLPPLPHQPPSKKP